jgi:hypothetical protein
MSLELQNQSAEAILERIDAIIRELEALRQTLVTIKSSSSSDDLARKLFGVLGQGSWAEYDFDLDWQRFEA